METLALPSIAFILLAIIAFTSSRGLMSLPTLCFVYLTCLYVGGLRLWLQVGSNTYLYVLIGAGALLLGIAIPRVLRRQRRQKVVAKEPESDVGRRPRKVNAKRQELDVGMHPQILLFALMTMTVISLGIWAYSLWVGGIPLTSGNPSVNWVQTSSGAMNRLLGSVGGGNLAFEGLGWYALYRIRNNRLYAFCASGCVVAGALYMAFQGSKGSAIMTLLWFAIALYYFNRKTPKLTTFILMALFALPVTWWVTSYYATAPGQSPLSIIYDRMTTVALQGMNFLIQTWVPRYGLLHGYTFSMDIARIKSQFEGGPRPVLFHEYIWNLLNHTSPYVSTGLSESLNVFGVGYANFGLLGGVLFMMVFGVICEVVDYSLMTAKETHFIIFACEVYLINNLIGVFMSGDFLIIGLETLLITILPKLFVFVALCFFFGLPFRIPLRWSRPSRKSRIPPRLEGDQGNRSVQTQPEALPEKS